MKATALLLAIVATATLSTGCAPYAYTHHSSTTSVYIPPGSRYTEMEYYYPPGPNYNGVVIIGGHQSPRCDNGRRR